MKTTPKRGAIVTLTAMLLTLLFPVLLLGIVELGKIFLLKEQLKFNVQTAVSGAVTCMDWDNTYDGEFRLDTDAAADALHIILQNNIPGSASQQSLGHMGDVKIYSGQAGAVTYYAEVFNIPGQSTTLGSEHAAVTANGPTVFLKAEITYKPGLLRLLMPMGQDIKLVEYASAALKSTDYEFN